MFFPMFAPFIQGQLGMGVLVISSCHPDLGQFSFKTVVTLAQNQNKLHALLQDYDYYDCAITTVCFDSSFTLYTFQFGPNWS